MEEALATMKQYGVRRLPVIDGHNLVGIVSQADIARNLPEGKTGDLVEAKRGLLEGERIVVEGGFVLKSELQR